MSMDFWLNLSFFLVKCHRAQDRSYLTLFSSKSFALAKYLSSNCWSSIKPCILFHTFVWSPLTLHFSTVYIQGFTFRCLAASTDSFSICLHLLWEQIWFSESVWVLCSCTSAMTSTGMLPFCLNSITISFVFGLYSLETQNQSVLVLWIDRYSHGHIDLL